ncbi:NUDIX domain-containing protein [Acinetobacter wanghuae]|uniref:Phosphatase NudJ n=1 Tax=Acinetobacter wanghuae TaxID=2662362 RepID=A0A5Q0P2V4_9GAMM|nr:NUDIX hydrolase [Acinetobacter wanghuae]MQW93252.1 NUDIX domain-containing protein [Acinetobacter wanghuae]QGA10750.1 NUDIX domain-containing protein [Acinetobacter wanghuae]
MTAWTAHVTVATVVEKDGKFLFVEEHTEGVTHTVFNQPAGHVEAGETIIEAAIRETMEETGHTVEVTNLLGMYTYTPPMFPDRTYYRFCFLATSIAHDPHAELDTGIVGAVWMTLDELIESARARSPLVIKAVQDALSGQKYPLSLIYEHQNSPLISNLDA